MQAAFFLLHPHVLPYERAIRLLEDTLKRKFSAKGSEVINANLTAISKVPAALKEIVYPKEWATATMEKDEESDEKLIKVKVVQPYLDGALAVKG